MSEACQKAARYSPRTWPSWCASRTHQGRGVRRPGQLAVAARYGRRAVRAGRVARALRRGPRAGRARGRQQAHPPARRSTTGVMGLRPAVLPGRERDQAPGVRGEPPAAPVAAVPDRLARCGRGVVGLGRARHAVRVRRRPSAARYRGRVHHQHRDHAAYRRRGVRRVRAAGVADAGVSETARRFPAGRRSAALRSACWARSVYHLLSAAHATRAPWPVVVLVSRLPVVTLGFGAALTHLLHDTVAADDMPPSLCLTLRSTRPPGQWQQARLSLCGPRARDGGRDSGRGAARRRRGERAHPERLSEVRGRPADGRVPSLRAVMRDLGLGQPKAREIRAHLASLATANGQAADG